ncbi:ribosomal L7Ae/L30e/S12e/Gadd45 family protein [Candidatus Woesearchaeota archaeon]|nr:ribosomal L7Ae/L30e/S12e/Gadd45 family protein [Candidatus Woesearchaeota archaeon]
MAETTNAQDKIKNIKQILKTEKILIGVETVLKALKAKELETVYLASNCKDSTAETIRHYSELSNAKVVQMDIPNDELGIICKKMFSISVLGIKK